MFVEAGPQIWECPTSLRLRLSTFLVGCVLMGMTHGCSVCSGMEIGSVLSCLICTLWQWDIAMSDTKVTSLTNNLKKSRKTCQKKFAKIVNLGWMHIWYAIHHILIIIMTDVCYLEEKPYEREAFGTHRCDRGFRRPCMSGRVNGTDGRTLCHPIFAWWVQWRCVPIREKKTLNKFLYSTVVQQGNHAGAWHVAVLLARAGLVLSGTRQGEHERERHCLLG